MQAQVEMFSALEINDAQLQTVEGCIQAIEEISRMIDEGLCDEIYYEHVWALIDDEIYENVVEAYEKLIEEQETILDDYER